MRTSLKGRFFDLCTTLVVSLQLLGVFSGAVFASQSLEEPLSAWPRVLAHVTLLGSPTAGYSAAVWRAILSVAFLTIFYLTVRGCFLCPRIFFLLVSFFSE